MTSSAFDAWKHRAATTPIATAAEHLGLQLKVVQGRRGSPIEKAGPCPRCGGDDRFAINTQKSVFLCRKCGGKGHGAIDLAIFARDLEQAGAGFLQACELLTGEPPPDRGTQLTDADRERFERQARELAARNAREEEEENSYREAERRRLFGYWRRALDLPGTPAEAYIKLRCLRAPPGLRARCILDMPYYSGGGDKGEILAHAPVLVLPIVDAAGTFRGLHFTYIDLAKPKGKLELDDRDGVPLKAKKMRGSVKHNKVVVAGAAAPTTLVIGEGFEKTLAVWMALEASGRDLGTTAFWSACDLGNLTGKAAGRGKDKLAAPDPEDPGIAIPDSVTDLVLLGDTTSDAFTTQCAMYRAQQRYAREGRVVRVFWAPAGKDFDDVAREAA